MNLDHPKPPNFNLAITEEKPHFARYHFSTDLYIHQNSRHRKHRPTYLGGRGKNRWTPKFHAKRVRGFDVIDALLALLQLITIFICIYIYIWSNYSVGTQLQLWPNTPSSASAEGVQDPAVVPVSDEVPVRCTFIHFAEQLPDARRRRSQSI